MKKYIEIKDNDWKEAYVQMAERCKMLEEELEQEQEKNRKCKCSDKYYEVIKRLDIIGDMVGDYIRKAEKEEAKSKMEKAKAECEYSTCMYNDIDMHYSNKYRDELRYTCQCEER